MKVGVFLDNVNPTMGGANGLLQTILYELNSQTKDDLCFEFYTCCYKKSDSEYFIDGFKFINLLRKLPFTYFVKKAINVRLSTRIPNNALDKFLKKKNIDLFWIATPTYMDLASPYIFTVWDLGHRTVPFFPEVSLGGEKNYRDNLYKKMISFASYVLIGNETGAKEIVENYNCDKNIIRISPFPISFFCYGDEAKPEFIDNDDTNFFFYPAQFWAHKNHIRIVEAVKLLKSKYPNICVYFTGTDKGTKEYILEKISEYGLEKNVVITGFLSYPEMKYMYTHAEAMIFASLMGPNNLPPIEATYLGCPVIITDIPGHVEQLRDSALYFNGYDENDLALKMELVLNGTGFTEQMKNSAKALSQEFKEVNYCDTVLTIFDEFKKIRKCWK